MRQLKVFPQYTKSIVDRTVTGLFSVFGVRDDWDDIMYPGSFLNTFEEQAGMIHFLWGHDFYSPPTAVIKELREVDIEELPDEVKEKYPEATGGAEVVREYLNTERANEALEALNAGAQLQMSFGYNVVKYYYEKPEDAKYSWEEVRHIQEVKLFEVSDVLWGANEATRANLAKSQGYDILLDYLESYLKRSPDANLIKRMKQIVEQKAERRHSLTHSALAIQELEIWSMECL